MWSSSHRSPRRSTPVEQRGNDGHRVDFAALDVGVPDVGVEEIRFETGTSASTNATSCPLSVACRLELSMAGLQPFMYRTSTGGPLA